MSEPETGPQDRRMASDLEDFKNRLGGFLLLMKMSAEDIKFALSSDAGYLLKKCDDQAKETSTCIRELTNGLRGPEGELRIERLLKSCVRQALYAALIADNFRAL